MSLDLTRIAPHIGKMIARLKSGDAERQEHLRRALETLHNPELNFDALKKKVSASKTTWLVAGLTDGLNGHYKAPHTPHNFTIIATDGSNIDIDRHQSARCYLINIGGVVLSYGAHPEAKLDSFPSLYFNDEDMVIPPPSPRDREQMMEGQLIGIRRNIEECRKLAELAAGIPAEKTKLALLDGTLILWGLEGYPDFVAEAMLDKGLLTYLDDMFKRKVPLASYVSFPGGTDVVNVLRVALCPHEVADCDRYCSENKTPECEAVTGVQDRDIMVSLLDKGERSALFISPSRVVEEHYGKHRVFFFYLRNEDEIARIEMPAWVAEDESQLNIVHSLVLDQCRRGQGYPVALSEAHEKAVISGADRELFWQLVESSLVDEHMPVRGSAKNFSKRTRWI